MEEQRKKKTVMIAGGGTGGHIYPGVALAIELMKRGYDVTWMGSGSDLEKRILSQYPIKYKKVTSRPYRGRNIMHKVVLPIYILSGVCGAMLEILAKRPAFVITMGGYVSITSALAARLLKIPVHICEQNSKSGMANRLLSRIATMIFTAYPGVFRPRMGKKILEFGNPLRKELVEMSDKKNKDGKKRDGITILVIGGSQGAQALNEHVPRCMKNIKENGKIRVIHQAGAGAKIDGIEKVYKDAKINCQVACFFEDMANVYEKVDMVIARAGALTISELVQFSMPSILIPLPGSADNHQFYNALYHQRKGVCWILKQEDLSNGHVLHKMIEIMMVSKEVLKKMSAACARLRKDNAAESIIQTCEIFMEKSH